jgi:phosphatidylserine/phosphatidylglycerophosphate/cardiolipin synthase-like enzyme
MNVRLGVFAALVLATTAGLGVACSSSSSPAAPGPTAPTADAEPDDDAQVDAGPRTTKSCDPLTPRAADPEIFIGPTGLKEKLVSLIGSAKTSLDILMYELDDADVISALVAAQKRGVTVRMVLDRNNGGTAKSTLVAGGVAVHDSSSIFPYAHAKSFLIDKTRSVIMSMNMNGYSIQGERNYGAVSTEPGDAEDLSKVFEADFAGTPMGFDLGCSKLLVAPVNARPRILDLISSTKSKLVMSVMYLTDPALLQATLDRAAAGVATRIILADPGWIKGNDATAQKLAAAKIPVKYMKFLDCHAKLVVSDDRAFVGSENMSSNSVDANREVGIIVSNPPSVAPIEKQFEADWSAATVAP